MSLASSASASAAQAPSRQRFGIVAFALSFDSMARAAVFVARRGELGCGSGSA
jgi:hypothetical protein